MKGLVSYSKKFGVNLHYCFTFRYLTILNPLIHIYDPQYSTEVSVAKAISYLLHDQSNDILLPLLVLSTALESEDYKLPPLLL